LPVIKGKLLIPHPGGGFFNANSAHPFENPTPFSNFLQILSIFILPVGLTYTLGRMTGSCGGVCPPVLVP